MGDLTEAASSGDRVATLEALRDLLASALVDAKYAKDVAPLVRQMTLVLADLAELKPPERKGTPLDELANRRSAGVATSSRKAAATGRRK